MNWLGGHLGTRVSALLDGQLSAEETERAWAHVHQCHLCRDLVEREGWISSARFNRLLAVMQVLPGPEAHELCVHLGIRARGRLGGFLAGLGFMLPGLVLMLGLAWAYVAFAPAMGAMAGAFLGIQVVVVAIIVRAVQRIGVHVLEDWLLWALAIVAGLATLAGAGFWIVLAASGAIYAMTGSGRRALAAIVAVAAVATAIAMRLMVPQAEPVVTTTGVSLLTQASALALFWAGLKAGMLTFGGAYTAIPYVRADTVGRGWIGDGTFLDGVAFAGVLPAPLVIFCTFVGYVAGGWAGALAITAGVFLPAFAFSMVFYERLEAVVENVGLHRLLAGVAAAAVGIIAATSLQLGWATALRVPSLWWAALIFVVGLAVVWRWKSKFNAPVVIVLAAIAGWAAFG